MELTKYHLKEYGPGGEKGEKPDPNCCAQLVYVYYSGLISGDYFQCRGGRGYGPDGAFCEEHDPENQARDYACSGRGGTGPY